MDIVTAGTAIVIGKKLLGKTFDVISDDIAKLYEKGRDKIIEKTFQKVNDPDDGKSTNLRVTRDVFWNGAFTDEEICAEYFGGILASSRSKDGKDDSGVYYVDIIKSLSSNQLMLHYLIYYSFNKKLIEDPSKNTLNPGQETELHSVTIYLFLGELIKITNNDDIGRDLHALHAKGLIGDFQTGHHKLKNNDKIVPYLKVSPKPLGIQLYAIAHNKLDLWRKFSVIDFGKFQSIDVPKFIGTSVKQLLESAGITE